MRINGHLDDALYILTYVVKDIPLNNIWKVLIHGRSYNIQDI